MRTALNGVASAASDATRSRLWHRRVISRSATNASGSVTRSSPRNWTSPPAKITVVQHESTATSPAENDSGKPSPTSDLRQRPRATSSPGVRIEAVRESNPLSSTQFQQFSGHRPMSVIADGSQAESQVLSFRHGGRQAPRLGEDGHLL